MQSVNASQFSKTPAPVGAAASPKAPRQAHLAPARGNPTNIDIHDLERQPSTQGLEQTAHVRPSPAKPSEKSQTISFIGGFASVAGGVGSGVAIALTDHHLGALSPVATASIVGPFIGVGGISLAVAIGAIISAKDSEGRVGMQTLKDHARAAGTGVFGFALAVVGLTVLALNLTSYNPCKGAVNAAYCIIKDRNGQ